MKILHTVEFYNPSVGGAQEVVKQLSEHLVMLGHDVTVATSKISNRMRKTINGVKIKEFDIKGNQVKGYVGDVSSYKEFLINSDFDVIMNYATQQWASDIFFQVINKVSAKKVLVPCGLSGLHEPLYSEYFSKLPNILKKYDHTVYLSNNYRDINFAKKYNINNRTLIPNGADESEFSKVNKGKIESFRKKFNLNKKNTLIISVGNHTGSKGHRESIKAFIDSRIHNSTLMIIGNKNSKGCFNQCWISENIYNKTSIFRNDNKKIINTNLTRSEVLAAFQASDIFLFLSNIECSPLVLFESIASGTPFISSDCGNSKEISEWSKAGLICRSNTNIRGYTKSDINHASLLIKKMHDDKNLREEMGRNGRKIWKNKFTWKKLAKMYEKLYES